MLTLYFFAPIVLYVYGVSGFLLVYLGSIVIGNLFSLYLYKRQSWYSAIGASGGVSGILFAAVAYAPNEIEVNFLPGTFPFASDFAGT
jgi:membrane associated rhomboid family serine protease